MLEFIEQTEYGYKYMVLNSYFDEGQRAMVFSHKQVPLDSPWGTTEWVDEGMVPLLSLLWRVDIQTVMSCVNQSDGDPRFKPHYPHCTWLYFYLDDALNFLDLVRRAYDDVGTLPPKMFVFPHDDDPEDEEDQIHAYLSVRFSAARLEEMVKIIKYFVGDFNGND